MGIRIIDEIIEKNKYDEAGSKKIGAKWDPPYGNADINLKKLEETSAATSLAELGSYLETSERSTLYRTIKKFEEVGIVHQIQDGTGIPKYALCEASCNCEIEKVLHLHFHCTNCKETVCLTDQKIPQIGLPEGFVAEDVNLIVKGICEKC